MCAVKLRRPLYSDGAAGSIVSADGKTITVFTDNHRDGISRASVRPVNKIQLTPSNIDYNNILRFAGGLVFIINTISATNARIVEVKNYIGSANLATMTNQVWKDELTSNSGSKFEISQWHTYFDAIFTRKLYDFWGDAGTAWAALTQPEKDTWEAEATGALQSYLSNHVENWGSGGDTIPVITTQGEMAFYLCYFYQTYASNHVPVITGVGSLPDGTNATASVAFLIV